MNSKFNFREILFFVKIFKICFFSEVLKLYVYCRPESNDVFDKLLTQYQTRSDNEKVFKSTLVANFECRLCSAIFSKEEFLKNHKCTYVEQRYQQRREERLKKSFINIQPRPTAMNSTLDDLKTTVEIQDSKLISRKDFKKNSDNSSPRGNNSIGYVKIRNSLPFYSRSWH